MMSKASGLKRTHQQRDSKWRVVMKPGVGIKGGVMGMLARSYRGHVPEVKSIDILQTQLASTAVATPPVGVCLIATTQGANIWQHIGQRIVLKSLRLRGFIENTATQTAADVGRILVVYDRQANAALPSWASVIQAVPNAGNGSAESFILDGVNLANRDRFLVLIDEQIYLPAIVDTAGAYSSPGIFTSTDKNPSMFNFDRYVNLKNLECHFNNTNGATVADIQTGSIVMFFAAGSVATTKWQFTYTSRIRFLDI